MDDDHYKLKSYLLQREEVIIQLYKIYLPIYKGTIGTK